MTRAVVDFPEPDFTNDGHRAPGMDVEADVLEHVCGAISCSHVPDCKDRSALDHGRLLGTCVRAHGPKGLGVVLRGVRQHGSRVGFLDLFAFQQDLDPVGHLGDDGEIVGDVERGRIELLDDVADGCKNLDLRGDVQSGCRLVKDDQVRAAGHGHCCHGPLQLASRNLVGIAEADAVRLGQLHAAIEVRRIAFRLTAAHDAVLDRTLAVLVDQLVGRVEAGRGRLRHVGDAPSAQVPRFVASLAARMSIPSKVISPPEMRQPSRANPMAARPIVDLPAPDSPMRPRTSPFAQFQVHALDDIEPLLVSAALDAQALDGQEDVVPILHGVTPSARLRGAAASPTTKFTQTVRSAIAPAGKSGVMSPNEMSVALSFTMDPQSAVGG